MNRLSVLTVDAMEDEWPCTNRQSYGWQGATLGL